ncbi:MAG: ABC transporter ATP-binding protein [Chloroflexota bacterium]|nr:ABC transporter ATP-binding protein [Chloroflexota bacterium]
MIELKQATKLYRLSERVEVRALDNVNLRIEDGDFVIILGPSGSGKSTMLNMLGALDRPTSGSVILDDVDLARLSDNGLSKIRRYKIGFIFQFFNLVTTLTAVENVMLPLSPVERNKAKLQQKAESLLTSMGLESRMDHRPTELSGGEQQRVAIARALMADPRIILGDEPTGNLDSKTGHDLIRIMKELNVEKGITFIIVSHDPSIASVGNRVIQMKDGHATEVPPPNPTDPPTTFASSA